MDKVDIIKIAQDIDTLEISNLPFEDCCTIFTPKAPATKPKSYKAEAFEKEFDFEKLINECVDTIEEVVINNTYKQNDDIF